MNKKGFATLAVVLIVVVLLMVAGGVWYYKTHPNVINLISNFSRTAPTSTAVVGSNDEATATTIGPTINSIYPPSAPLAATITVNGSGFSPSSQVDFNGVGASVMPKVTSSTITFPIPFWFTNGKQDLPGNYSVTVTTVGGGPISNAVLFTVSGTLPTSSSTPSITKITPSAGPIGTTIAIDGSGFLSSQAGPTSTSGDIVRFNGMMNPENSVATILGDKLQFVIGAGLATGSCVQGACPETPFVPGAYSVTVTSPSGKTSNAGSFTVTGVPTISRLSPATAAVGETVTISGSGFAPKGNVVVLNGLEVAIATSSPDSNTLTVTIPGAWENQCSFTGTGLAAQDDCSSLPSSYSDKQVSPSNYGETQYTYPLEVFVPNAGVSNSVPFTIHS
jgi:hypothetical protein